MKDLFYSCFVLMFFASFVYAWKNTPVYEIPDDVVGIVIDKDDSFLIGTVVQILQPDSTIQDFRCYDILFDSLHIGDSINFNTTP